MQTFHGLEELGQAVGTHLGHGPWQEVTQKQVDGFARATGDHQWIHVDVARATAGPFGGPISHGYLTLSSIPVLLADVYAVTGLTMAVNYGCNKVRFPSPVPVGSRIRAGVVLTALTPGTSGVQAVMSVTVEREGADKPACVAEIVILLVP